MPQTTLYGHHDFVVNHRPAQGADPFRIVLSATFIHESGARIENVPGFYDGDDRYVIRFSPDRPGKWTARTCSEEAALDGRELPALQCTQTERMLSGMPRIDSDNSRRFVLDDGTPYIPLGFVCDWLFAYHQRHPEDCARQLDRLAARGFNTIEINVYAHTGFASSTDGRGIGEYPACDEHVYAPPDLYVFGGSNEKPDHRVLNVEFFRKFDRLMELLEERRMVAHVMFQAQNKRVNWPVRRSMEDDRYWTYVTARYQGFRNLIWDIGKECGHLRTEFGDHSYTIDRIALVRCADAHGHLVTAHDTDWKSDGGVTVADRHCDHVSDQPHLGDADAYHREALAKQRLLDVPYVVVEYGYEEGVERLKTYMGGTCADWQTILVWTWSIYASGAYAYYYYNNTAWDLIKFDPEPPGWSRYTFLRDFLASIPYNEMAPADEFTNRGFCLAKPGAAYFVFLPEGGDVELNLVDLRGADYVTDSSIEGVQVTWLDICTGQSLTHAITSADFRTALTNPLAHPEAPCAIRILSNGGAPG